MTDKQIIDKCPISEKCKEFENCKIQNILQQLQAKEQECERLRDTYKKRLKIFCDMYNQLKAENEELKKNLDFQKNMYECARADEEDKFEEILELKQTLAEIKEICLEAPAIDSEFSLRVLEKISEVLDE